MSTQTTPWDHLGDQSTSNLAHDSNVPEILSGVFTTLGFATIFVFLRLWTRARIVRSVGLADFMIILALITSAGMCAAMVYGRSETTETEHGMGRHYYDIDMERHLPSMMKGFWFSLLFYILSLAFTKISICLLYLTIFTLEWARKGAYAVLAIVVIHNTWATITTLTMCIPLHGVWDHSFEDKWCQPPNAWWVNTGLTIVTDFLICILPIPIVGPLKLPRRQKIVVVGIFAIGFFICIVSLIRLVILIKSNTSPDPDTTYNNTNLNHLTVLEVQTAIIVSCLMTLKPLVSKFFPNMLTPRDPASSSSDPSVVAGRGTPEAGAQLTIGSRPLRNNGGKPVDWIEAVVAGRQLQGIGGKGDDVILRDIDVEAGTGTGMGEKRKGSRDTIMELQRPAAVGMNSMSMYARGGTAGGSAASVRTEQELGPEVCARSLG
ncbi:hypothetical protein QBC38DRAFT_513072 [Podospora fimiseda]|uniref:Rhodopsin domain-containing protein n=1 Tax=Podospora fimiseda TaxID=252190 RepID=A0AAN6YN16_9PEZI|nr:hypothetical protein QBC38DRAFT_513072 [Podospora fimiseda]